MDDIVTKALQFSMHRRYRRSINLSSDIYANERIVERSKAIINARHSKRRLRKRRTCVWRDKLLSGETSL